MGYPSAHTARSVHGLARPALSAPPSARAHAIRRGRAIAQSGAAKSPSSWGSARVANTRKEGGAVTAVALSGEPWLRVDRVVGRSAGRRSLAPPPTLRADKANPRCPLESTARRASDQPRLAVIRPPAPVTAVTCLETPDYPRLFPAASTQTPRWMQKTRGRREDGGSATVHLWEARKRRRPQVQGTQAPSQGTS